MGDFGGSTQVTFPQGDVTAWSRVVETVRVDGGQGVVTAASPFHPLDPSWPDQPGDTGLLQSDGLEMKIVDCVTGAAEASGGPLLIGSDIPARRGDPAWDWVVVHVVERSVPVGADVRLMVDADRRNALSAGHTGCHLMALALNAALAGRWRKDVPADGLGHPDFDRAAVTRSRIVRDGSVDTYRIGKSLRKKGFDADGLAAALPAVAGHMEDRLAAWIATDAPISIAAPDPGLAALRRWRCALPEGTAEIPCGGTHLTHLGDLGTLTVALELSEAGDELVVETRASGTARLTP
ncbi:metal-dependent hydrolase [Actinomadura flavalba]|uniref:metal-dependent hydrolase n=1 Tax=Actinomadura flavalba TaxID=1120938 RepID=UPI0004754CDE|nr:metal-dependent hydrolase [Actinomadura flavalba]